MRESFKKALALTLRYEGGFSDHPDDPGGATMKGVTEKVYHAYRRGKGEAPRSVRSITEAELRDIYKVQYWDLVAGDRLPAGVDAAVFDYAVNSGATRAGRALQSVLGVRVDGNIGLSTINAAKSGDATEIIMALCDERLAFMKRLKTWRTFGKGWSRRVEDVRKSCIAMVDQDFAFSEMDHELAGGAAEDDLGAAATADPRQVGFLSTNAGRGGASIGVGTIGTMATDAADKFEAIAPYSTAIMIVSGLLLVVGLGFTAYGVLRSIREERAA